MNEPEDPPTGAPAPELTGGPTPGDTDQARDAHKTPLRQEPGADERAADQSPLTDLAVGHRPDAPSIVDADPGRNPQRETSDPGDDIDTPSKRRVMVSLAALAVLGALLVWGASAASGKQAELMRDAQSSTVAATVAQADGYSSWNEQFDDYVGARTMKRRYDLSVLEDELLGIPFDPASRTAWEHAFQRMADLTPLLQTGELQDHPDLLGADLQRRAQELTLRGEADADTAADWGRQADLLQGGAALAGIAGTLLGLSLTVHPSMRRYLAWPVAGIVLVTCCGSGLVLASPGHRIDQEAILDTAEGQRLVGRHQFEDAERLFDRAVSTDPRFAAAYIGRADAATMRDNPQRDSNSFIYSSTSDTARRRAVADLEHALELGRSTYPVHLSLGANYLQLGDLARSEAETRQAIALSPDLPLGWLNLAAALAAQGRTQQALDATDRATTLVAHRPTSLERQELYTVSRAVLLKLQERHPERAGPLAAVRERLVASEGKSRLPDAVPAPNASVTTLRTPDGSDRLQATVSYRNIPAKARVAWIVDYRASDRDDWIERPESQTFESWQLSPSGDANHGFTDSGCPIGGQYRVELYVDGHRRAVSTSRLPQAAAAFGSRPVFTRVVDEVGGLSFCRPDSWVLSRPVSGRVDMTSADGASRLALRALPLRTPPTTKETRLALARKVVERIANQNLSGATTAQTMPVSNDTLSAFLRVGHLPDQRDAGLLAAVSTDGVLRTALLVLPAGQLSSMKQITSMLNFPGAT